MLTTIEMANILQSNFIVKLGFDIDWARKTIGEIGDGKSTHSHD